MSANAGAEIGGEGFAITQVVLKERESRDRCWWDSMSECFASDSTVRISWFAGSGAEFTAASREMWERGVRSRHRLGPPVLHRAGDRGVVTLPAVVETYPSIDDVECIMRAYCRLLYGVETSSGRWKIARMGVVYERDELVAAVPGQEVHVDPAELSGLRTAYRLLAWSMTRSGFPVRDDLPGDDRPETVDRLYADVFAWAGR